MTYHSTTTTFEFTAFAEADLTQAGDNNIGCGDTFVMPDAATTCITVVDNDGSLSGDYRDNARDHWGQQASIENEAGVEVGNGGQIYAEVYHWVSDAQGNWYVMIEIEQEGSNADYFTFYNGHGFETPPEGAELTVHGRCNVKGEWVAYDKLGAGDKEPPAGSISGRVFLDEDCDGVDGKITVIEGCDYTIEAEDMHGSGFVVTDGAQASGGEFVKLGYCDYYGDLSTTFDGKDGTYDFSLFVQDENDGQSRIMLKVNGELVEAVRLDRDTDGAGSDDGGFSEFVIEGVELKAGDQIMLWAEGDYSEFVRIDRIELNGRDEVVRTEEPGVKLVTVVLLDAAGVEVLDDAGERITTVTNADGSYSFDGVPAGDYRVKFENPDGTEFTFQNVGGDDAIDSDVDANGVSDVFTIYAGETTTDIDAGLKDAPEPGSLSGTYFCDEDGDGVDDGAAAGDADVAGRTVSLLLADGVTPATDINGDPVASVLTDQNGDYRFTNLAAGDYVVVFEPVDGKSFIAPDQGGDDAVDSDVDPATGATAPVTVVAGEETTDVDAGVETADPMTGEIGDTVWIDLFGDGVLNDEALDPFFQGVEQGAAGVTVQLKDAATGDVLAEQVTDADGKYLFTGLAAGDYVVGFIPPAGFEFTAQDAGGDDARDSDADQVTGMTDVITLEAGESILTVDAGLLRCGLIEGTSQADENSPVGGYDLLVGCETNDTIIGLSGEDTLFGQGGDDDLRGDSFDDVLFGGDGNDVLRGGAENDVLDGGLGDDLIAGDGERDVAVFSVNRADATIDVVDIFSGELLVTSADGVDTVQGVEVLRFADGDVEVDTLLPGGTGDAVAAPAAGGSVNIDVLANDIGVGVGTLVVAQANDGAFGSVAIEADGTVTYTASADFDGYDFFTYTVSNGEGFVRTVEVQVGDLPRPEAGDAGVVVLDDVIGADGIDFVGTGGEDLILGGSGFDTIDARNGADIVDGGKGEDFIRGGNGDDLILGGEGDDRLQADNQADAVFGELGDDNVIGQGGDDNLFGGEGGDLFIGQGGSDFMAGGDGDDTFRTFGDGADIALGGAGADTFQWSESNGGERDLIDGESGVDSLRITLDDGADAVAAQAEIDAYLALVAANAPAAASLNDGSVLTETFSFTTIDLDIRNVEDVFLA